ncbi:Tetratricopeptide TPR_1 repeat-containing protein [Niastella koreensis GR20-10]|uniref:Tetratricopeptide TPR_1 repeat-containing protein n=2 Tax=Niastella koreensis TaxID=354356 RepID=G8T9E2_NIAKG|nr:tetratricopeptide repeat protein [Niastella koreensis]AEV99132.1 Tetratricopeptide TPR_1 repeat-containing protein [Niastella koreensis GR20-10]
MRTIIALMCLLLPAMVVAWPGQTDFLSVLKNTNRENRLTVARKIYNDQLIHLDSTQAFVALNRMYQWATNIHDMPLKIFSVMAMGDYLKEYFSNQRNGKALEYFTTALNMASQLELKESEAEIYNNMGWLYYKQDKFPQAFEYMIRANNIIQKIGYENYPHASRYLYDLGYIYCDFGNYEKARLYLTEAIRYSFSNSLYAIRTLNTLGLAYRELKQYDSAILYFNRGLDTARAIHNVAWTGILSGNLGSVYYFLKHYDEAVPLLKTDYELSMASREWTSAANTIIMLADLDLDKHLVQAAALKLDEARDVLSRQTDRRPFVYYALQKARLFKYQKRYDSAFAYLDTARRVVGKLNQRRDALVFSQAEQKVAVELHLSEIKLLESEKSKMVLVRNFIIVVILLVLIIAAQLIFRQQLKQKKNKELLNNAVRQLHYYIESVREKNQLINQFKQEIELLHAQPEQYIMLQEKEEIAAKLKQYSILTENDWNEFRNLFEKVQIGFFSTLKQRFPDLTPSEQRLLALMKLNLSKREMAGMLGIAPDSIKKTRQRIRKKINVIDDVALEELVASL